MSTWYDDYWAATKAAIAVAWPEVRPGALATDTEASKRDWKNLLDSQQMTAPFVVVKTEIVPNADDGPVDWPCYDVTGTIWRIDADNVVDGTDARIVPYIAGKLITLSYALLTSTAFPGTVRTAMPMNCNGDNAVGVSLIDADQRFTSGSLAFTVLIVDTAWQGS